MCTKIENFKLHCRTCLKFCVVRHDIDEMPIALLKLLQICIGEDIQDDFYPDFVCDSCFEQLKNFDEFQSMTRKSTELLKEMFSSQKNEATKLLFDVKEENNTENVEIESKIPEIMLLNESNPKEENLLFEEILIKEENEQNKSVNENEINEIINEDGLTKNMRTKRKFSKEITGRIVKTNRLEISCKFGCGKIFHGTVTAENHYRRKHSLVLTLKTDPLRDEINKTNDDQSTDVIEKIETKPPLCEICNKTFSSQSSLRAHIKALHEFHEQTRFSCNKCDRTFSVKARLKIHIREVHANPIQIPCKYGCGKIFRRLESAKCHYRIKHNPSGPQVPKKPKNYPTFICEDCGRTFPSMAKLREHNFFHRPPEERPFKCEQCDKSFVEKRTYEDHLKRHAGIKQFECPYCGLKKVTKRELRFHMNCHTKEKQFSCDLCDKVFNRHYNLKKHKSTVHYGIRKHQCRYCDLSFGEAATRRFHEITHTGNRPHKCKFCDRSFIQPASLKAHLKTHKEFFEHSESECK